MKPYYEMDVDEYMDTIEDILWQEATNKQEEEKEDIEMNAIEEIKKGLYESYKWLYEEAMNDASRYVQTAMNLRKAGNPTSAAFWLNYAGKRRRDALRHKHSMQVYAS